MLANICGYIIIDEQACQKCEVCRESAKLHMELYRNRTVSDLNSEEYAFFIASSIILYANYGLKEHDSMRRHGTNL